MRTIILLLMVLAMAGCTTTKQITPEEDVMYITRRYVGTFLDYRYVKPQRLVDPHTTWVKTSLEEIYGKIPVVSRKCKFTPGEPLFVRRRFISLPGNVSGFWHYSLESSNKKIYYPLSTRRSGAVVDFNKNP